jgi:hypothetical protein
MEVIGRKSNAVILDTEDRERLARQRIKIWDLMRDGKARTLSEISQAVNAPEASVSARLRDFRKARYGGHTVNKVHLGHGLYSYWLIEG